MEPLPDQIRDRARIVAGERLAAGRAAIQIRPAGAGEVEGSAVGASGVGHQATRLASDSAVSSMILATAI